MKKIALSLLVVAASGAYVWSQSGASTPADPLATLPQSDGVFTGSIQKNSVSAPKFTRASASNTPAASVQLAPFVINRPSEESNSAPQYRQSTEQPATQTVASLPLPQPSAPPPPPPAPTPAPTATAVTATSTDVASLIAAPAAPAPGDAPAAPGIMDARLPRPRPTYQPPAASQTTTPPTTPVAVSQTSGGQFVDGIYTGPVVDAYYGLMQIQAMVQNGRLVAIRALRYPSDRRTSIFINRQALPMLRDEVIQAQSANVDIISGATFTSEAFIRSLGTALRKATS